MIQEGKGFESETAGVPLRPHLTYANVVSTLCLFVLLGGSAYAGARLARDSVLSKNIKNGEVRTADLRGGAVTSAKVADGKLLARDFAAGQIPAGPQGAKGDAGPQGPQGAPGVSGLVRESASTSTTGAENQILAACPAGTKVLGGGASWSPVSGNPEIVIQNSFPNETPVGYTARAHRVSGAGEWQLTAYAVCGHVAP